MTPPVQSIRKFHVLPGQLSTLRARIEEINLRRDEILEILRLEKCQLHRMYLIEENSESYLIVERSDEKPLTISLLERERISGKPIYRFLSKLISECLETQHVENLFSLESVKVPPCTEFRPNA